MSSVVISGDISGSVTLDAPSVAGTTVLTLPATSGTIVTTATTTGISGSAITTGTVGVSVGGTGQTTAGAAFNALSPITTTGDLIIGNGTNSATRLAIGSNNTVLTSNGSTATWAAAGGGSLQSELFTAPGTWTRPSTVTQVRVTVVGGGGAATGAGGNTGGFGGLAVAFCPVSNPVAITIGAGASGFPTTGAGTSSFGALVSATGGGNNSAPGTGTPGTGTVTTGTVIKTGVSIANVTGGGGNGAYVNGLAGVNIVNGGIGAQTYSTSSGFIAGAGGRNGNPPSNQSGGSSGAVLVEWVG